MATAALRGILVVVAVVLGFIVTLRAFPEAPAAVQPKAAQSPTPQTPVTGVTPGTPTLPATNVAPTEAAPPNPADAKGVTVQVLNGANESGLAASTASKLEGAGYKIVGVANAQRTYQVTTIFYRPDSQVQAQQIATAFFPGAKLEPVNNNNNPQIRITVVLGEDYAAQN